MGWVDLTWASESSSLLSRHHGRAPAVVPLQQDDHCVTAPIVDDTGTRFLTSLAMSINSTGFPPQRRAWLQGTDPRPCTNKIFCLITASTIRTPPIYILERPQRPTPTHSTSMRGCTFPFSNSQGEDDKKGKGGKGDNPPPKDPQPKPQPQPIDPCTYLVCQTANEEKKTSCWQEISRYVIYPAWPLELGGRPTADHTHRLTSSLIIQFTASDDERQNRTALVWQVGRRAPTGQGRCVGSLPRYGLGLWGFDMVCFSVSKPAVVLRRFLIQRWI